MHNIISQLNSVKNRIYAAEKANNLPRDSIRLLAVSKMKPAEAIIAAYDGGQRDFGENYLQHALPKIEELKYLDGIQWHFIGPLQSNKTKAVAENFHWIHSIDRLKIASRLNEQRPDYMPPLNICLQVNVSGEHSKSGMAVSDAESLAQKITALPNLNLRGLMTIPAATADNAELLKQFGILKNCFDDLRQKGFDIDTLSMGMSADLETAVASGSNMVRVGTAIFGAR